MRIYYDKEGIVWIAPGAVRFDSEQVDFLLPWLYEMRAGIYKREPAGGYTEIKNVFIPAHAKYETVCQVASELDRRLAMTGHDRDLVEKAYCEEMPEEEIAHWYNLNVLEVRYNIERAVAYISSGECPRWIDCSRCLSFSKCRKKKKMKRRKVSYRHWCSLWERRKEDKEKRTRLNRSVLVRIPLDKYDEKV
jgi:hypothetical protein